MVFIIFSILFIVKYKNIFKDLDVYFFSKFYTLLVLQEYRGLENCSVNTYSKYDLLRSQCLSEVLGSLKTGCCSNRVFTELARLRGSDTPSLCSR